MRIGIDIMGGDYSPNKTIHGAILAREELPSNINITLFGKKDKIIAELQRHNFKPERFSIIDCTEVINMDEHPTKAFRSKQNSSISIGFEY